MMRSLISLTSQVIQCCTVQEEGRREIEEWRRGKEGERKRESGGELHTIVTVEKVFNFTSDQ